MSELKKIPLDVIDPSETNPRKNCQSDQLADLAVSIGSHGVLQPILIRPVNGTKKKSLTPRYELVAGERRWRAAKIAGLATIPAIVRELSDRDALEIQVIENEQREDLGPMEKAAGYKALIDGHKVKVDDLAAKIGKSSGTIYGLLKLLGLPKEAVAAMNQGELLPAAATMIARIPNPKLRAAAWDAIKEQSARYEDGACPVRMVKSIIEREFMVELKGAPFDTKDEDLTLAGACTRCPKCTGNNRAEFPDGRGDMCTDTACFAEKKTVTQERLLVKLKADGATVLAGPDGHKIFDGYNGTSLSHSNKYVDMKDTFYSGRGSRFDGKSYGQFLLKAFKDEVVYVQDKEGTLHELVERKRVNEALKTLPGMPKGAGATSDGWKAGEVKRRKEAAQEKEARRLLLADLVDVAQQKASALHLTPAWENILRQLALAYTKGVWHEIRKEVCKRRQLESAKKLDAAELLQQHIGTLDADGLMAYLAEVAATRLLHDDGYSELTSKEEFFAAFGLSAAGRAAR